MEEPTRGRDAMRCRRRRALMSFLEFPSIEFKTKKVYNSRTSHQDLERTFTYKTQRFAHVITKNQHRTYATYD